MVLLSRAEKSARLALTETMLLKAFAVLALLQQPKSQTPSRAEIERSVAPVLTSKKIPGAVIAMVREDSIVFIEAFGVRDIVTKSPMHVDDLFMIGSVTKQFTATLIAMLADEKRVSLDAPVARYLDARKPLPAWTSKVTLRQLANHTSGLDRNPVNRRNRPNSPSVMLPYSRTQLYEGLVDTRLISGSGTKWNYSNIGFALLGEVVERVTGQSYDVVLRARILNPIGMLHTGVRAPPSMDEQFPSGYWTGEFPMVARPRWEPGEVVAFAGMYSDARDLARFLSAQSRTGAGAPFSQGVRQTMQTATVRLPGSDGARMSLAWFIDSLPQGRELHAAGGEVDSFSSSVAFSTRSRAGLVVLVNRGGESAEQVYDAVLPAFLKILGK